MLEKKKQQQMPQVLLVPTPQLLPLPGLPGKIVPALERSPEMLLQQHNLHAGMIKAIARQIEIWRALDASDRKQPGTRLHAHEFEARLGTMTDSGFVPGIPERAFLAIQEKMDSFSQWASVTVTETTTYYFRSSSGDQVRTKVTYLEDGIENEHLRKKTVSKADFRYKPYFYCAKRRLGVPCQCASCHAQGTELVSSDLRVAISTENVVAPSELPDSVLPSLVRIASRKSYLYNASSTKKPLWRYDLSRCWSATTKADAETLRAGGATPVYEFECEGVNMAEYIAETKHTDLFVALSLTLKLLDFMVQRTAATFEVIAAE